MKIKFNEENMDLIGNFIIAIILTVWISNVRASDYKRGYNAGANYIIDEVYKIIDKHEKAKKNKSIEYKQQSI